VPQGDPVLEDFWISAAAQEDGRVYLEDGLRRAGLGRALYGELSTCLSARGFRTAVAGTTLPDEASAGLHRAMGFEPVGVHRRIGWEDGAWHDVAWVQRDLADAADLPGEPRCDVSGDRPGATGGRTGPVPRRAPGRRA
jgi:hypothetical protein